MKAKKELVTIPYPLTDADKADTSDRLLEIKLQKDALEEEKSKVTKQYKEQIDALEVKIDYEFSLLKKGIREGGKECMVRKNFHEQPPLIEYVNPDNEKDVFHSVEMEAEGHQLSPGDWVIDEDGKSSFVPEMETEEDEE